MAFKMGNIGHLLGYAMPAGAAYAIWKAYSVRGVGALQADITGIIKNPKGLMNRASGIVTGAVILVAGHYVSQAIQKRYTGKPTVSMLAASAISLGAGYMGTQQILTAVRSGAGYGGIVGASQSSGGNAYNPYQLGGNQ